MCIRDRVLVVFFDATRSAFLYRERLGLAAEHHALIDDRDAPPAAPLAGNAFHTAWRNYVKTVFKKGFMYKLSCGPSVFYVSENKSLAGKEDRHYEGEALGRKLVVIFLRKLLMAMWRG